MSVQPCPKAYTAVTPYLTIANAAEALTFYKKAFNAEERMRLEMPGNRIGHAEISINGAIIMISDEFPEMGSNSPKAFNGTPVAIHLYVDNVDQITAQAVAAGAKLVSPVDDKFYGDRSGTVEDPYGHRWYISTHIKDVTPEEMDKALKEMAEKKDCA